MVSMQVNEQRERRLLAAEVGTRTALALGAMLGASGFLWTLFSPGRRLGVAVREARPETGGDEGADGTRTEAGNKTEGGSAG